MKIVPHADCDMISMPTKFCASNPRGGCDITITVVDCGMCQFTLLSKPLQLNISMAFQYFGMKILTRADCKLI
jgi:hypothetical protein